MRVTIVKNDDGTVTVSMRRTRREEKPVRPVEHIKREDVATAVEAMVKEMRPQAPSV